MELNKKILGPVFILLIISWTANTIYYNSHRLKEPLFLKHYYDIKIGMPFFQLFYVDNMESKTDIAEIFFPEIGREYNFSFNKVEMVNDGRYYKMNRIDLTINEGHLESIPDSLKNKVITMAQIRLTNGEMVEVDLGRIYLYSEELGTPILDAYQNMSSSNNSGSTSFRAEQYIRVNGVNSRFPEIVSEAIEIKINGKPFKDVNFPIELKVGDNLQVDYSFNFKKDDNRRNHAYNFSLDLLTEDREGNKSQSYVFINQFLQSPEQIDVEVIKKDRGY